MPMAKMSDINLHDKRLLIRVDLNVPMEDNEVVDTQRIEAILPTLKHALEQNARIMLMSHLGRPKEGEFDATLSLEPIAKCLSKLLQKPVRFLSEWIDHEVKVDKGEIVLFENVRFLVGEKNNDPNLAQKMAKHCELFVNDAFATAHRKEASTYGVAEFAPRSCAGPLLIKEITALNNIMKNPSHPLLAIVGGAKVSTKLSVLESLIQKVDALIIGGGIANTFLAAQEFPIGKSLYEPAQIPVALRLLQIAEQQGVTIPLPSDVVVGREFSKNTRAEVKPVTEVKQDEMILDVGPATLGRFKDIIAQAKTILWNGPVGVFEWDAFSQGTKTLAELIAKSGAYSVAGGGDTLAAIDKFGVKEEISYISTGGGAFLEFIEGKKLPAVAILERSER